jgi:hypothetical protein
VFLYQYYTILGNIANCGSVFISVLYNIREHCKLRHGFYTVLYNIIATLRIAAVFLYLGREVTPVGGGGCKLCPDPVCWLIYIIYKYAYVYPPTPCGSLGCDVQSACLFTHPCGQHPSIHLSTIPVVSIHLSIYQLSAIPCSL